MKASKTAPRESGSRQDELEPILEFWAMVCLKVALFGEDPWGQLALHVPCLSLIMHACVRSGVVIAGRMVISSLLACQERVD